VPGDSAKARLVKLQRSGTPVATEIKPLKALAVMATHNKRFEMNSVSVDAEGDIVVATPPPPAFYRFVFDGLKFAVALTPQDDASLCRVSAPVGPLPFTAENAEARLAVLTILRSARQLHYTRFTIAAHQMIMVTADLHVDNPQTPEAVMLETVRFLHEARPFLRLLTAQIRAPRWQGKALPGAAAPPAADHRRPAVGT
jgi:hypothetical protein